MKKVIKFLLVLSFIFILGAVESREFLFYSWVAASDAPVWVKVISKYNCDGASDQVKITEAINQLTSGRTKKESIKLMGSFTLSGTINLPSYTTVEMSGAELTASNNNPIFTIGAVEHVEVIGGKIDGDNTANNGILLNSSVVNTGTNILISNVEITGFLLAGVNVANTEYNGHPKTLTITGCYIHHNNELTSSTGGIMIGTAGERYDYTLITDNILDYNNRGISIVTGSNHIISNNRILHSYGQGIRVEAERTLISSNVVNHSGDPTEVYTTGGIGIFLSTGSDLSSVIGNYILSSKQEGLSLYHTSNCIISNNVIEGNGELDSADSHDTEIRIYYADNVSFTSNIIGRSSKTDPETLLYCGGTTDSSVYFKNNIFAPPSGSSVITGESYFGDSFNFWDGNISYVITNSGTETGTGSQQTIPHGLSVTPNVILLSGANAYQSAAADASNIYVTADVNDFSWYVTKKY